MAPQRTVSAWFEIRARWVVRRVAAAVDGGLAVLAECLCERGVQLLVVRIESADPVGSGLQAAEQRGAGGSLPFRRRSCRWALVVPWAELLDLGSEVGLGVEPGSGDAGFAGDGVEADRPRVVGRDQVLGIVRSHWPSRRDRLMWSVWIPLIILSRFVRTCGSSARSARDRGSRRSASG